MVFKTVDGHLTSVFNKVEKVKTGFNLTNDEVQRFVNDFNKLNSNQNFGQEYTDFIAEMTNRNFNVSQMFDDISKQGASARASVKDFYAAILDGNTKGFSNVKSTMALFNQAQQSGADNARDFAKAVGQSNTQLGGYLSTLGTEGTATLKGYTGYLVSATAKTIGLQLATAALNVGISLALNAIIWGITKVVNRQKELSEQAKESSDKVNEQAKSLDELKKRYEEICNSTDDEKTKNEQLNEIKQELVDTYGLEKTALEELNTERQKGVNLLDEEFEKKNRNSRNEWLDKNKEFIQKSKEKMAYGGTDYFSTYLSDNNISESILKLFDNKDYFGATGYVNLEFDYTDTVDRLEKLKNIYNEILEIQSRRKLTDDEQQLLNSVKTTLDSVQDIYDSYYDPYSNSAKYESQNIIENYLKTDAGKIENVGKDTFNTWRKGLIEQATNEEQRRYIQEYIEDTFPDISKYFNNLDLAKSKFGISDTINSATEGMKLAFINSLDDTDLDILVNKIEDPFKNGIEGAKKAIEDFKADPKNQINVETDTSSLEEMEKKLEEYSKSVSSFTKAQDTISDAYDEQAKHGQLASDTIQSLIDAGYSRALSIDAETGAVTLNASAVEALNNQKKFSLLLDAQKQKADLVKQLEDEKSKIDALTSSLMTNNEEKKKSYVTDLLATKANAEQIESQIAMYDALMASLDAPNFDDSSKKNSDDPWKDQFENEYNEKQHLLALNQISEEEYINWLDDAYKQYFSDLTKYQDEYWKYEEEVYKWRTEQEQKLFDKKIDNYEKLADKALEDNVDADGNKLELSLSFDYAREQLTNAIAELQQRINDIRSGVVSGTEDDIEQLKEDIDSLNDKLKDIDDKEVTAERDFLKDKKDEYSDFYDEQIDKLKEQQDEAEKLADQEKEAIQAKIDLLEEVNSKKSEEIDLEKKRQELEKAKSQRTIARLNADGTTSYIADAEKINDAQEEYDNAKYEYQKSLLEAQIKAIEKAAKEQSEKYDDQIKLIEEQKKMIEEKFDALIKPLDDFLDGDKQTASNANVWDMISKISGSTYENGVWSDKDGNAIDINNLVAGIDDLTEQEKENSKKSDVPQKKSDSTENSKTGDDKSLKAHYELLAKYFQNKGMKNVTADSLEKYSMNLINNGLAFKNPVPNISENVATKTVAYNNSRHTENITNNIGDIVINNPVGSAEDLGKEILKNGATIFNQQTHTNRK